MNAPERKPSAVLNVVPNAVTPPTISLKDEIKNATAHVKAAAKAVAQAVKAEQTATKVLEKLVAKQEKIAAKAVKK